MDTINLLVENELLREKIKAIIHCQDCIYAKEQLTNYWCKFHLINCWDDDFCSWGEDKDE